MLEGVSVDPGCSMLPVSRKLPEGGEPLIHGDRGMLPSSTSVRILFHPLSPKHLFGQSRWKVVGLDGCGAPAVRGYRLLEEGCAKVCVRIQGQGRERAGSTVTTWGATTSQILALREHLLAGEGDVCGDRVDQ